MKALNSYTLKQEKGSKETKGTKKDPKYLRALQDCKAQGQAPGGKVCVCVCVRERESE